MTRSFRWDFARQLKNDSLSWAGNLSTTKVIAQELCRNKLVQMTKSNLAKNMLQISPFFIQRSTLGHTLGFTKILNHFYIYFIKLRGLKMNSFCLTDPLDRGLWCSYSCISIIISLAMTFWSYKPQK